MTHSAEVVHSEPPVEASCATSGVPLPDGARRPASPIAFVLRAIARHHNVSRALRRASWTR
ncbi:hypothetical protein [Burkholderia sp. THE68]|uniref:hypothetical protein n=1 Tax=Burkholderia sp. THE68 TaxID=758782 RepID=UPI0013893EAF|nr:hypothetical protein [Burkholderia sp. THE68]